MQEKSEHKDIFLERTDVLSERLNVSLRNLADHIGISQAMLFAYRTGKHRITSKAWSKLEAAERKAGIQIREKTHPLLQDVPLEEQPSNESLAAAQREHMEKFPMKNHSSMMRMLSEMARLKHPDDEEAAVLEFEKARMAYTKALEEANIRSESDKADKGNQLRQFSDRCELLCAALRLNHGQLAVRLKMNRQHLSALMNGKTPITQASWKKLEVAEAALIGKKSGIIDSQMLEGMVAEAKTPGTPGEEAFEAYREVLREFRDIALLRYPDNSEKQSIEIERLMLLFSMMKGESGVTMDQIKALEILLKK